MMKRLVAMGMAVAAFCAAEASVWTTPVKAGVKKVASQVGGRTGGEVVVRGGAALARATAEREVAKAAGGTVCANVAKTVTPGKILAAGGAVAMVTAAHEAADGVQQVGESIGDVTRQDPGIATRIAEVFMRPITWGITLISAVGTAVLAWFFLPLLTLVRNWMRFRALKQASGMQPAYVDVVDVDPGASASVRARSGKVNVRALFAVAGFLALSGIGIISFCHSGKDELERIRDRVVSQAPCRDRVKVAKRAQVISGLQQAYQRAVQGHYEAFRVEVEQVSCAEFGRVREGVPCVADSFGTFSRCKRMVCDCVLDKMRGGNRTSENIRRDLEQDYYAGLYAARDRVIGCLGTLRANLDHAREQFEASLKGELSGEALPGDDAYKAFLADCGERIETKKAELSDAQLTAGIAVAIEAVLIRETVATVSKCFAKSVARQTAAMAGGAATALADGPLPIGDIIGGVAVVGTTAWTCYDVYKASKVVPGELRSVLNNVTSDCEKQCLEEVRAAGERALEAYSGLSVRG